MPTGETAVISEMMVTAAFVTNEIVERILPECYTNIVILANNPLYEGELKIHEAGYRSREADFYKIS